VYNDEKQKIRKLIAGSHADFLSFLISLPNPIVVGNEYPRTKILQAFNRWAKSRNFDTDDATIANWREVCSNGQMKKRD
jgi:hypothetical protein